MTIFGYPNSCNRFCIIIIFGIVRAITAVSVMLEGARGITVPAATLLYIRFVSLCALGICVVAYDMFDWRLVIFNSSWAVR